MNEFTCDVGVVLVTYNRKRCLDKVLEGLDKQTYPIKKTFVFDNNSTDGTAEFLLSKNFVKISPETLDEKKLFYQNTFNAGGAGGFSKAVDIAKNFNLDYLWIMDDDVYPEKNCLENLLSSMKKYNTLAALPCLNDTNFKDFACVKLDCTNYLKYSVWKKKTKVYAPFDKDIYFIEDIVFEGPIIHVDVIRKIGNPDASYFILFDDTDYAQRILKYSKIIYVPNAKLHRQLAQKNSSGSRNLPPFNWKMYYAMRNEILFSRKYGKNWAVRNISPLIYIIYMMYISYRDHHLLKNLPLITKAFIDGMTNKRGMRVKPNY